MSPRWLEAALFGLMWALVWYAIGVVSEHVVASIMR